MLNIHLLGKASIDWDGESLDGQMGGKNVALLYLLLGNAAHFLPREKLMFYLWPDSTEEAARYNLRYNLWLLKKILPLSGDDTLVLSEKDGCRINSRYPWWCDLTDIKCFDPDRGTAEELLRVHRLFRGEIMEGYYLKNCCEFNDLILYDRMACESKHVHILQSLARHFREAGEDQRCLEALREVAAIEPNNEAVALETMETYIRLGDRAGAIQFYKRFEAALWNELSISPEEKLQALYRRLRAAGATVPPAASPPAAAGAITLTGRCMANIPYFLLADLIASALSQIDPKLLLELDARYIQDLVPIQMELALCYERAGGPRMERQSDNLLDVRVIQAFCKLVETICARKGPVRMRILQRERVDAISAAALEYLRSMELQGLSEE